LAGANCKKHRSRRTRHGPSRHRRVDNGDYRSSRRANLHARKLEVCFTLELLAGCIVYLARNGYSRNLFVIAPGETIYAKLIREFTPGEPAYLFKGIGGMDDMRVVTGDDYLYREPLTNTDDPLTVSPSRGDRTRTATPVLETRPVLSGRLYPHGYAVSDTST
jgi:hypothetical protein